MQSTVTLKQILELVSQLSLLDKVRLIEGVAPQIERELSIVQPTPRKSLYGLCAGLEPVPSAEEIDEARREAWANFPREDV